MVQKWDEAIAQKMIPHVTLVLANYMDAKRLMEFVTDNLLPQKHVALQIVIVENGNKDGRILSEYCEKHVSVQCLFPQANLGYFGAARLAFQSLSEDEKEKMDFFVLSNYDMKFRDTDSLSRLLKLGLSLDFDVFGPQIYNMSYGSRSNPMYLKRPSKKKLSRLLAITDHFTIYRFYQRLHALKNRRNSINAKPQTSSCYAIHGSFMVFTKKYFGFQENFAYQSFLYGEELFVAEQCSNHNLRVGFISEVELQHYEHASTGKVKNRVHMKFLHDSLSWLHKTYFVK